MLEPADEHPRWRRGVDVDVIVVGGGPAGSCAAIVAARAGLDVVLLERGPFPGSKNMYGGVVYPRILDELIPNWWEEAPIQRWVTRRSTMLLTDTQALTVDFRSEAWGAPPYNGATAFRPDWDHWLAGHAEAAGAQLLTDTTVIGLHPRLERRRSSACAPTDPTATCAPGSSSPATASTASSPRRPASTSTPTPSTTRSA